MNILTHENPASARASDAEAIFAAARETLDPPLPPEAAGAGRELVWTRHEEQGAYPASAASMRSRCP
ncbi:MAG: hypothetical protein ABI398_05450 [Devosia sp.]